MPKPKNATALYEVIRKADPNAGRVSKELPDPEVEAQDERPEPAVEPEPSWEDREPLARHEPAVATSSAGAPPIQVADGKVRLALSPALTAVAIFVMAVLLVVAYGAGTKVGERRGHDEGFAEGRDYASSAAMDDIQVARSKAPTANLFEGVGDSPIGRSDAGRPERAGDPAGSDAAPASSAGWVPGYTYIVVQDFRSGDEAVMQQARQYLLDNGIETATIELTGGYAGRLITKQGFNWEDPVQKQLYEDYLAKIRKLGQGFFEEVGKYRLEGYPRTLKADTW